MSLYCLKRYHQVKEHRATRDSSSSVYSSIYMDPVPINDLTNDLKCNIRLFSDYASLFTEDRNQMF